MSAAQPIEPDMVVVSAATVTIGAPEYLPQLELGHPWPGPMEEEITTFSIGKYAVTREEYGRFVDDGGAVPLAWERPNLQDPRFPALGLSWENARDYAAWLSDRTGRAYRLPFAAEWEAAARGGLDGKAFPWGDDAPGDQCCWGREEADPPDPLDAHPPNGYGLYNMVGNAWAWCQDLWADIADDAPVNTPTGLEARVDRVLRGGSYMSGESMPYCAYRHEDPPDLQHVCLGMRLAL